VAPSRREFLKSSAAAAAGGVVGPTLLAPGAL
jgi:anaerobic selenocysteine-containing dehydrogenase